MEGDVVHDMAGLVQETDGLRMVISLFRQHKVNDPEDVQTGGCFQKVDGPGSSCGVANVLDEFGFKQLVVHLVYDDSGDVSVQRAS